MTRKIYNVASSYFQFPYIGGWDLWSNEFFSITQFTVSAAVFYHDTIICYSTVEIYQALQIHDNVNKLLTLNTQRGLSFFQNFAITLQNPHKKSIMLANCCGVEVLHLQKEINLIARADLMCSNIFLHQCTRNEGCI